MRVRACDYDSERERERERALFIAHKYHTYIYTNYRLYLYNFRKPLLGRKCLLSMNLVNSKNHLSSVKSEEDIRCLRHVYDMYNFLQYFL